MVRLVAFIFGVIFVAVGIMGYIPQLAPNGLLLGLFEVNHVHNIIHIASGVVALLASFRFDFAKLYLQIFGIVYGLVAILGFIMGGDLIYMHVNMADNVLHVIIAFVALYFGFVAPRGRRFA